MFDERRIRKHGLPAVVSMDKHSHITSNEYQRYDYVLDVQPPNEAGFRVEMHHTFLVIFSKPEQYDVVNVKYDPKSHETIFDFTGDPRFDLDAMKAHTAQLRKETAEMRATMAERGIVPGRPFPMTSPAPSPGPSPAASTDLVADIERLVTLRDSGALTQQEFELMKAKLIGPT
jgi:hypothetical protein